MATPRAMLALDFASALRREADDGPIRDRLGGAFGPRPTATAVMLTMPRAVTDGVRICAGLAAPIRIGPTGSASAMIIDQLIGDVGGVEVRA